VANSLRLEYFSLADRRGGESLVAHRQRPTRDGPAHVRRRTVDGLIRFVSWDRGATSGDLAAGSSVPPRLGSPGPGVGKRARIQAASCRTDGCSEQVWSSDAILVICWSALPQDDQFAAEPGMSMRTLNDRASGLRPTLASHLRVERLAPQPGDIPVCVRCIDGVADPSNGRCSALNPSECAAASLQLMIVPTGWAPLPGMSGAEP